MVHGGYTTIGEWRVGIQQEMTNTNGKPQMHSLSKPKDKQQGTNKPNNKEEIKGK